MKMAITTLDLGASDTATQLRDQQILAGIDREKAVALTAENIRSTSDTAAQELAHMAKEAKKINKERR